MDKILLRTLSILVDEVGRNDFEMASLINIGVRAKEEMLAAFAQDPNATKKLKAIVNKKEYKALFGAKKRLVDIITGLRPDYPLTEDSLTFDPVKMAQWVNLGEEKAKAIVKKSPFV
jgi:hypothetical protein